MVNSGQQLTFDWSPKKKKHKKLYVNPSLWHKCKLTHNSEDATQKCENKIHSNKTAIGQKLNNTSHCTTAQANLLSMWKELGGGSANCTIHSVYLSIWEQILRFCQHKHFYSDSKGRKWTATVDVGENYGTDAFSFRENCLGAVPSMLTEKKNSFTRW